MGADLRNDRFIALNGGSTIRNPQWVMDQGQGGRRRARFTTSAAVKCTGVVLESKGSGQRVEMWGTGPTSGQPCNASRSAEP